MKTTIFITTYKKYAEGNGDGIFIELESYNKFNDLMQDILTYHSDEKAPELMCTDPDGLPEFPETCNKDALFFFWQICRDEDKELLLDFLTLNPSASNDFNFDAFRDDAMNAYVGAISDVSWTKYPDFEDWAFARFLESHPELSEYEDILSEEAIARQASFMYYYINDSVFSRHA